VRSGNVAAARGVVAGEGTTLGTKMSHLVLGRPWCTAPVARAARPARHPVRRRRRLGDVPLSSRDSGAVGDRLDRPLDADVRDRLHGAARNRVQDDADAHGRLASQRPRPPAIRADVAGETVAFTQAATTSATAPPDPVSTGRILTPVRRRVRGNAGGCPAGEPTAPSDQGDSGSARRVMFHNGR
jgi:hypothetical protein